MRPLHVPANRLSEIRLCFGGEFGYELLSWLPYLNFVAHETGVRLKTCSRPGSSALYAFSSDHIELPFTWRPHRFGTAESDRAFSEAFEEEVVTPRRSTRKRLYELSLGGLDWDHQFIHQRLTARNYRPLSLSGSEIDFLPKGPVAVINNKDFDNWGNRDPGLREAFMSEQLVELRNQLLDLGYFVVYHPFHEPVVEDRFAIKDEGIFSSGRTLDMRDVYASAADARDVMRLQLGLYQAAQLVVCPQGGNSFLPIMLGKTTLVLSTSGRLVEYQDLARVYGADVQVYTSVVTILEALRWVPRFGIGATPA